MSENYIKEELIKIVKSENHIENMHQFLMDLAYNENNDNFDYNDLLKNAEEKYGSIVKFAVLFGNYNYQVENGGHQQYYDNGYSDEISHGFFNKHHGRQGNFDTMISFFKQLSVEKDITESFKNLLVNKLLPFFNGISFEIDDVEYEDVQCYECNGSGEIYTNCDKCDGSGEIDDEECDFCNGSGEIEECCDECNGSGRIEEFNDNCGYLLRDFNEEDDVYYDMNEKLLKEFDNYLKLKLIN